MTITKRQGRQAPIVAYIDITLADLVGATLEQADTIAAADLTTATSYDSTIALPAGAVVVGGEVDVQQVFNSATSDTLIVGDASDDNRYLTAGDLQVKGPIALLKTGFIHTAGEPLIVVKWTKVGAAPTTGRIRVRVEYYLVADVVTQSQTIPYASLTSGAAFASSLALPVGAVVIAGQVAIDTAFNSGTSDVVVVGDATTANRYVASTDIHTGAATPIPFVPTGYVHTASEPVIKLTWTKVSTAPSAGSLTVTVSYYLVRDVVVATLPANAQLVSGGLTALTAFNTGTADTMSVGDAASSARYRAQVSVHAAGRSALTPTGYCPETKQDITVRWIRTGTTAPTAGLARLDFAYLVEGRAGFTQD